MHGRKGRFNWLELSTNINDVVLEAQTELNSAGEAIKSLNIEQLNKSIEDRGAVIEPLAKFFKTFG